MAELVRSHSFLFQACCGFLLAPSTQQRRWSCEHCTHHEGKTRKRLQTDIIGNIIQEDTRNKHSWNSFPKSKANLCPPAPLPAPFIRTWVLTSTQNMVLCRTGQSCWWFHSSYSFLLVQQDRGSPRCHKQMGNGECLWYCYDSIRQLMKMKQGNNSHNSCWVREGPSPWQPLLLRQSQLENGQGPPRLR